MINPPMRWAGLALVQGLAPTPAQPERAYFAKQSLVSTLVFQVAPPEAHPRLDGLAASDSTEGNGWRLRS